MSTRWAATAGGAIGAAAAAKEYASNVILGAARGHGFAAEKANHMADLLQGKDARIVGGDNARNGADRWVDGTLLQTKYCSSGAKCVGECFENGKFKYLNPDQTPMKIEVPSDKYDAAIQAMQSRISRGEVPGVTDTNKAADIVVKGSFTYEQARNIARAGTVESITYDAGRGIQVAGVAGSISAALSFAVAIWHGESPEIALKHACVQGLKTAGVAWMTSIAANQLSRTPMEGALRTSTEYLVSFMGPKVASMMAQAAGKELAGAAAKSFAAKLLRGNVVTATISTVILSVGDITRLVQGRMSAGQAFKNVSSTAVGLYSGVVGWQAGAALGATVGSAIPILGTVVGAGIGGILGSVIAGSTGTAVTTGVVGLFIEEDAGRMFSILQECVEVQANEFLLSGAEVESVVDALGELELPALLLDMYAADDRQRYAIVIVRPIMMQVVQQRVSVTLPTEIELLSAARKLLLAKA